MGLAVLSEWAEALFMAVFPNASISDESLSETVQDIFLSDITMALTAILCAELFLHTIRWNYRFSFWSEKVKTRKGRTTHVIRWGLLIKYVCQLLFINGTFGFAFLYVGDPALVSLGLCVYPVWSAYWMAVFHRWNEDDFLIAVPSDETFWEFFNRREKKRTLLRNIRNGEQFYWLTSLFSIFFVALNIYKWTSYFLMVFGLALVFIFVFCIILLLRSNSQNR
jgi:hypothetical protein